MLLIAELHGYTDSHTKEKLKLELDLHLCSYPLARALSRYVVNHFKEGQAESLKIIFGQSTHNLKNFGKMEHIADNALLSLNSSNWDKKWKAGSVTIKFKGSEDFSEESFNPPPAKKRKKVKHPDR